jgi:hypothetical protein
MAVARAGFVAAFLVDRARLAPDRVHQGEIWREDEPLPDSRTNGTGRGIVPFIDRNRKQAWQLEISLPERDQSLESRSSSDREHSA